MTCNHLRFRPHQKVDREAMQKSSVTVKVVWTVQQPSRNQDRRNHAEEFVAGRRWPDSARHTRSHSARQSEDGGEGCRRAGANSPRSIPATSEKCQQKGPYRGPLRWSWADSNSRSSLRMLRVDAGTTSGTRPEPTPSLFVRRILSRSGRAFGGCSSDAGCRLRRDHRRAGAEPPASAMPVDCTVRGRFRSTPMIAPARTS
jgi:hypothetical protein